VVGPGGVVEEGTQVCFSSMTLLGVGGPDCSGKTFPAEPSLRAINQHAPALTKSSNLAKSKYK
jgi:hypothetical protein